ncbi:helix-turn-helix transcriptional regulator [Cellulomonas rhizosphaerae]|uniref:Helix-turn-helix transcriptional regulator n=1 Tax=Cellulomonas rhizosphaerae TaxID=2293719 RepID=A0A413RJG3_9CELL|nr:helix-turn-helix transcriptional regulator [Cellulomonas rhizosphaerae]
MTTVAAPLLGRADELRRLGATITAARNGTSGTLLVRGDPGMGKSALLAAATHDLPDVRILRSDGYEAESTMAFAGVHRLVLQLADEQAALPDRQRAALAVATGTSDGDPPDRFLVGLGLLGLLAAAARRQTLVCVVDDAHWLDLESREVLAFVARRLQAERVALLLAARGAADLPGLPDLELAGLDAVAAAALADRSVEGGVVDPRVASSIAAATGGNPLALIDLSPELAAGGVVGAEPYPVPIGSRLEAHYLAQVRGLPGPTRAWLAVAAAESSGEPSLVAQACAALDIAAHAGEPAETAGLVVAGRTIEFRHPLVRAAVYGALPGPRRREIHAALAGASAAEGAHELEVWHAAAAVVGTDEAVAARLGAAADRAGMRGGLASRARLLERAAELSPPGPGRDARLLDAAEAAAAVGAAHHSIALLDRLDPDQLDRVGRGRAIATRALLATFMADPAGIVAGTANLLRAAGAFHGVDPAREQRTLIRAFEVALPAEWLMQGVTLDELGHRLAAGADVAPGPRASALRGLSAHILLPYEQAVPAMRAALATIAEIPDAELLDVGYFGIALSMALWDERSCIDDLERAARVAREAGSLQMLDASLWLLSLVELVRGDPAAAGRYVEQVRELRRAMGYPAEQVVNVAYLAWAGAPREQIQAIADALVPMGFGGAWTVAMTGLSVRDIAEGHYRDAYERLRPMIERPFLQVTYGQLPDYVEAAVRSGHVAAARETADQLDAFARASGTPWIRGLAARSAALLAPPDEAEALYLAAIGWLGRSATPADLARAHLVYGEWLRREKRRVDAREHLRVAVAAFERIEAPAFARRAATELAATGEHVPPRGDGASVDLTPREATIARRAAAGETNAEIGAALFISANTVDYHLRKVFRKLGVTSRRQLAQVLPRP